MNVNVNRISMNNHGNTDNDSNLMCRRRRGHLYMYVFMHALMHLVVYLYMSTYIRCIIHIYVYIYIYML